MSRKGIRPTVAWAVVVVLALLSVVLFVTRNAPLDVDAPPAASAPMDESAVVQQESESSGSLRSSAAQSSRGVPSKEREPVPYIENLVWGDIDLREAQAVMPDNLYWKWGAPTSDPDELAAREAEKQRRNKEYGRVLAGDANEEEVGAYYDYRERLSADYLEFAQWMRNRYGDALPQQLAGLLDLSAKLHAARLLQTPDDRERALEHSRTRARIREEWQREQAEFGELAR